MLTMALKGLLLIVALTKGNMANAFNAQQHDSKNMTNPKVQAAFFVNEIIGNGMVSSKQYATGRIISAMPNANRRRQQGSVFEKSHFV